MKDELKNFLANLENNDMNSSNNELLNNEYNNFSMYN